MYVYNMRARDGEREKEQAYSRERPNSHLYKNKTDLIPNYIWVSYICTNNENTLFDFLGNG